MENVTNALSMSLLERKLSNQSLTGMVAIVLGDVKMVVWEEQISDLQSFDAFLTEFVKHPDSSKPEWHKPLTEAHNFLKVPPILPDERFRPGTNSVSSSQESSKEPIAKQSLQDSPRTVNESIEDCRDRDNGQVLATAGESVTGRSTQPQNALGFCKNKAALATISRNESHVAESWPCATQDTSAASRLKNAHGRRYETGGRTKSTSLGKSAKQSLMPSRDGKRAPPRQENTRRVVSKSTQPSLAHTSKGSDEDPAEGSRFKSVTKPVSPRRTDDNSIGNYDEWIERLARLVKPDAPWKEVYHLMVENGLYWKYSNGLHSHAFVFPGRLEPGQGGKVKYDFVYDEFDLKEIAVDSLNWNGDKLYLSEKVEREHGGRLQNKRVLNASPPDAPKAKKSVHTNLNDQKP